MGQMRDKNYQQYLEEGDSEWYLSKKQNKLNKKTNKNHQGRKRVKGNLDRNLEMM